MNPTASSNKHKMVLVFAGLAVWCILCYALLISPRVQALHKAQADLTATQKELSDLSARRLELERMAREIRFGMAGGKQIFMSSEIPGFLRDLNRLSQASQTTLTRVEMSGSITNVTPESAEAKETVPADTPVVKSLPLKVSVRGSFPQIYEMLHQLEQYNRLISITDIEAQPSQDGYPSIEVTLPIVIYVADLNMAPGKTGVGRTIP